MKKNKILDLAQLGSIKSMKYLYLTVLLTTLCIACRDIETFTLTVKNESGVPIEVIGYYYPDAIEQVTYLENQEELTKVYRSDRRSFDLRYFFTSTVKNGEVVTRRYTDSLKVFYNNKDKYNVFSNYFRPDENERDPLNLPTDSDLFTFTEEDYNNAIDCNGECE